MKYINILKWWIIYHILNSKERSILLINLNNKNDKLEQYSECLGETYQEYIEEVNKFRNNIRIFTP